MSSQITAWLTLRHFIVTLSVVASGVNISGIIPQLRTMLAARSSRGQSSLGWTLAATCSGSLLFVNAVGYHAFVLAGGNFMSLSGCLTAAYLARRFRQQGTVPPEALEALHDAPEEVVSELPTGELEAFADVVVEEQHRRATRVALSLAHGCGGPPTDPAWSVGCAPHVRRGRSAPLRRGVRHRSGRI